MRITKIIIMDWKKQLHHSHIIKGLTKALTVMSMYDVDKFDLIAECTVYIAIIAITFAMLDLFE